MRKTLRVLALLLVLVLAACSAAGCTNYNYNESEDLQFASGMAIDRTPEGEMLVTVELETAKGGLEMQVNAAYLQGRGDNLIDAQRNMLTHTDKVVFWNHMDLILVSQEIAQVYMAEVTDMAMRMPSVRLGLTLAVSKMPTASEVLLLEKDPKGSPLNSDIIIKSIDVQKRLGKAPNVKLFQFLDTSVDEGESAILPAVSICANGNEKVLEIEGAAVFNKAWLAGFLDDKETRTLQIVTNDLKDTVMALPPDPMGSYSNAAIEILPNRVSVKPTLVDGKPEVNIQIDSDIILDTLNGASNDPKQFKTVIEAIIRNAATTMESQVYALIEKSKEMNSADVIGIGSKIQDQKPKEWKQINFKWRDLYKDMKVTVTAKLKMRNTGLAQEPLKKGD